MANAIGCGQITKVLHKICQSINLTIVVSIINHLWYSIQEGSRNSWSIKEKTKYPSPMIRKTCEIVCFIHHCLHHSRTLAFYRPRQPQSHLQKEDFPVLPRFEPSGLWPFELEKGEVIGPRSKVFLPFPHYWIFHQPKNFLHKHQVPKLCLNKSAINIKNRNAVRFAGAGLINWHPLKHT